MNIYKNMVQEVKGKNLGILYFPDFVYRMTRTGKADEFSPCERMFACQLNLAREKFPTFKERFIHPIQMGRGGGRSAPQSLILILA